MLCHGLITLVVDNKENQVVTLRSSKSHPRLLTRLGKLFFFFSFAINTKINKVSTVVIFYIDNVLKSLPMNIRLEHAASGAEVLLPVFQISVG